MFRILWRNYGFRMHLIEHTPSPRGRPLMMNGYALTGMTLPCRTQY